MRDVRFMVDEMDSASTCPLHGTTCLKDSVVWKDECARLLACDLPPRHPIAAETKPPVGLSIRAFEQPTSDGMDGAVILFPLYATTVVEQPYAIIYFGRAVDRWRGDPIAAAHISAVNDGRGGTIAFLGVRIAFDTVEMITGVGLPSWARRLEPDPTSPDPLRVDGAPDEES